MTIENLARFYLEGLIVVLLSTYSYPKINILPTSKDSSKQIHENYLIRRWTRANDQDDNGILCAAKPEMQFPNFIQHHLKLGIRKLRLNSSK